MRLTLVATLACLLGATACSGAQEPIDSTTMSNSELLTSAEAQREYEETAATLTMPAGYSYPEQLPSMSDESDNFTPGVGAGDAVQIWHCAWIHEWLATRTTDPVAAEAALDMIAAVQDTPTYQQHWDPASIQEPFVAGLDAARLGDPTYFQHEAEVNCKRFA